MGNHNLNTDSYLMISVFRERVTKCVLPHKNSKKINFPFNPHKMTIHISLKLNNRSPCNKMVKNRTQNFRKNNKMDFLIASSGTQSQKLLLRNKTDSKESSGF